MFGNQVSCSGRLLRSCGRIGLANCDNSLAYAELFLVIGNLLSRYEITAWETPDENMEWVDHLVTTPKGKLQVLMKKRAA